MSNKKLTILGLIAILMVVWAAVQSNIANKTVSTVFTAAPLIQGLNPEDISVIEISKGSDKVVLTRKGSNFVISGKDDYPGQNKAVNELITRVLDIKTTGNVLTSNETNFDELNVSTEKAESVVQFFDKQNKLLTGVVVGKRLENNQTAVRLANGSDVYTTDDYIWIKTQNTDYMDKQLLDIDTDDIARVKVITPQGQYEMAKDANSSVIKVETEIAQGKQLKSVDYEQVFKALDSVSAEDVIAESKATDLNFDIKYVCQMNDTTVYVVDSAKKGDEYFVKISADFKDRSQISIDKNESQDELKKKETVLLARDNADKLQKQFKGWVYKISSYKAENLRKDFESLIEEIPQETIEDPNLP